LPIARAERLKQKQKPKASQMKSGQFMCQERKRLCPVFHGVADWALFKAFLPRTEGKLELQVQKN